MMKKSFEKGFQENMEAEISNNQGYNKAKTYQVALFPFNNAATNCYLTLMTFVSYYGGYYLFGGFTGGIISAATMAMVTTVLSTVIMAMRIFDGITDPPIGGMIDKTNTKFGKFRPYMVIGNIILAVSVVLMFFAIRYVGPEWLRWTLFILCYVIYVLGYTAQCACTKAGQTCITNEPHQRSQFVIWNMVGMIGSIVLLNLIGNGLLPMFIKGVSVNVIDKDGVQSVQTLGAQYNPEFYNIMVPVTILLSAIYTLMAVIAIWDKDKPEFWGVDASQAPAKFKDYVKIMKENTQIRWLVTSAGFNKLASTVSTSGAVAYLLYYIMMGSYNGLYIPIYALSFIFMGLFFVLGAKTAGNKGQKRAITQYTAIAFLFYIGLVVMLMMWDPNDPNRILTILQWDKSNGGNKMYISINLFTVIWVILYGCGYGAYNCCSEMCIPMVADCTDYETYRSGSYVPGIMGTIFSLIDKLVSSLATLFITIFTVYLIPGLHGTLPSSGMDLTDIIASNYQGVKISAIITVCVLPMVSWLITLICMLFYKLSGEKLREIQAVNSVRKAAIKGGMSKETAMKTWVSIDQVPPEFVPVEKKKIDKKTGKELPPAKENILDKIYQKVWGKREKAQGVPSSHAIPIPSQYAIKEETASSKI
jgi:Na+/melibiose symporter-like transporter